MVQDLLILWLLKANKSASLIQNWRMNTSPLRAAKKYPRCLSYDQVAEVQKFMKDCFKCAFNNLARKELNSMESYNREKNSIDNKNWRWMQFLIYMEMTNGNIRITNYVEIMQLNINKDGKDEILSIFQVPRKSGVITHTRSKQKCLGCYSFPLQKKNISLRMMI